MTEGTARMDWARDARTGLPEAVYAEGKTVAQLIAILSEAAAQDRPLLLTRLATSRLADLPPDLRANLDHDALSQTAIFGTPPQPAAAGVTVVCAGLADMPVVGEAVRTLAFSGVRAQVVTDVGVAGLWRLLERLDELRAARIIIAVAGMEGALFSVLAGLVSAPIIAVPTSVGHGVATGGHVALNSALASCAPGLVTVNIDNGFGAAQSALRILHAGR
ncbi:1-(5-phosphoribosyl)-5-amino-4-imidazole-carboxylate carboxylase [Azorhizobium oxalatiphilum]|uniref:1-(5-phosphoribosyl)-5-amino-4-imidazole-carboxylate carboxylase n=1 Tax=Azorhizobium oxalatiphilum TaxID=980631 RepID=A0A917C543_9HYPH|nr:nickel pincer cofactor biosynthesis protein LarB [Azorhizobium oxalatiphilum]GGF72611.1 1-(5-phosphoribosyl)-5-amino-4-imidazole-carboxylate carboxylase [Azorhizobium oxalatiphilum]